MGDAELRFILTRSLLADRCLRSESMGDWRKNASLLNGLVGHTTETNIKDLETKNLFDEEMKKLKEKK